MPDEALLSLSRARRVYGEGAASVAALDGVSLDVRPGTSVAITGRSGSGKSTLLSIVGLLETLTSGSYLVGGRDVTSLHPGEVDHLRATMFGFVFQAFHLLPHLTVAESVEMGLTYRRRVAPRARRAAVADLLERVGLSHRRDASTTTLSGGEKQRTAIARALIARPAVLLADEPTGNLDEASASDVLAIFDEVVATGVALILVTHDPTTAARCDATIRLRDGRVAP